LIQNKNLILAFKILTKTVNKNDDRDFFFKFNENDFGKKSFQNPQNYAKNNEMIME